MQRTEKSLSLITELKQSLQHLLDLINQIRTIKSDNLQFADMPSKLLTAIKMLYAPLSLLESFHRAHSYSQLAMYLLEQLTTPDSSQLSSLLDELANEVSYDIRRFSETLSLLPNKMTKQELIEIMNCYKSYLSYEDHDHHMNDVLFNLLTEYMKTDAFKLNDGKEKLAFQHFAANLSLEELTRLADYFSANKIAEPDSQSFLYKLVTLDKDQRKKEIQEWNQKQSQLAALFNEPNAFQNLPTELHQHIHGFLDNLDNLACTSRFFHSSVSQHYPRWRMTKKKDYTKPPIKFSAIDLPYDMTEIKWEAVVSLNENSLAFRCASAVHIFQIDARGGHYSLKHVNKIDIVADEILALADDRLLALRSGDLWNSITILDGKTGIVEMEKKSDHCAVIHIAASKEDILAGHLKTRDQNSKLCKTIGLFNHKLTSLATPIQAELDMIEQFFFNDANHLVWRGKSFIRAYFRERDTSTTKLFPQGQYVHSICPLSNNRIAAIDCDKKNLYLSMYDINRFQKLKRVTINNLFENDLNELVPLSNDHILKCTLRCESSVVEFELFNHELECINAWSLNDMDSIPDAFALQTGDMMIIDSVAQRLHMVHFQPLMNRDRLEQQEEKKAFVKRSF